MKRIDPTKKEKRGKGPLVSLFGALLLLAAAIGIVLAFRVYLRNHTYEGPKIQVEIPEEQDSGGETEYLDIDDRFMPCRVMICDVPEAGVWANAVPGKRGEESRELKNGQILKAEERGTYQGKTYYRLQNGLYLNASISHVEPLISYTEVEGYLAITYISANGVKLRSWGDFEADNVVKSVYVGDKVQVKAKVETEKGDVAFITTEGYYITADTRYLNDYSAVPEEKAETKKERQTEKQKLEEMKKRLPSSEKSAATTQKGLKRNQ